MGDQGSSQFISSLRLFTLFVTIFYFLGGLSFLILGCWIIFYFQNCESVFCVSLMVLGTIYVGWSSLAFWCIYRGPPITMYIYGCYQTCIVMITLVMVAYAGFYHQEIINQMQSGLNLSLITSNPPIINIEFAQKTMKCCGVSNYTDWVRLSPQRVIPMSCCIDRDRCVTANYNDIYQQGCYEVIMASIDSNFIWIYIAVGALLLIPILGSTVVCFLGLKLENERNRERMLEVR